jgi:hypothetical protein
LARVLRNTARRPSEDRRPARATPNAHR